MTETYEEWLDQNDDFDPAADAHPERNFCFEGQLARILGISQRHIRRLVRQGVLTQLPDRTFSRLGASNQFMAYKSKPDTAADRLRERKAQALQVQIDKFAENHIDVKTATATVDFIGRRFLESIAEVGQRVGTPEAIAECAQVAAELAPKFAEARQELITGKKMGHD